MPRLKENSGRGPLCQDPQYRGILLQVAVSGGVYLPECRLLARLRWISGIEVTGPKVLCIGDADTYLAVAITLRKWSVLLSVRTEKLS